MSSSSSATSSSSSLSASAITAEKLTETLRLELEKTNQVFSRWADKKEEWLDNTAEGYERAAEEDAAAIQALRDTEAGLSRQETANENMKTQLQLELEHNERQFEALAARKQYMMGQLTQIMDSRSREQQENANLIKEHDEKRASLERAYNDLTLGIRNFSFLGLDLQKAQGNRMTFVFTQIDPANPSRQFYFQFYVDEMDQYKMGECYPLISPATVQSIIRTLNEDNDITRFTVSMRREFVKMV